MTHERYRITHLQASGRSIPSVGGALLVVYRENSDNDWELVHQSSEHVDIERGGYDLVMDCPGGELTGPALLVRSDGRSHVFRGAGTLSLDGTALSRPI